MTKTELDGYRDRLRAKLLELGRPDKSVIAISEGGDEVEQAVSSVEREGAITLFNNAAKTIREVCAALGRIDRGEYGVCVQCEEPVSAKRLNAIPWASHCILCQERQDAEENSSAPLARWMVSMA